MLSETLLLFCFFRLSTAPKKSHFLVTFCLAATLARVIAFRTTNKERIKNAAALVHAEGRTRGGRRSSGLDRPNPPRISVEVDGSCGLTLRPRPVCCDCGGCHWRSSASTAANGPTASWLASELAVLAGRRASKRTRRDAARPASRPVGGGDDPADV